MSSTTSANLSYVLFYFSCIVCQNHNFSVPQKMIRVERRRVFDWLIGGGGGFNVRTQLLMELVKKYIFSGGFFQCKDPTAYAAGKKDYNLSISEETQKRVSCVNVFFKCERFHLSVSLHCLRSQLRFLGITNKLASLHVFDSKPPSGTSS